MFKRLIGLRGLKRPLDRNSTEILIFDVFQLLKIENNNSLLLLLLVFIKQIKQVKLQVHILYSFISVRIPSKGERIPTIGAKNPIKSVNIPTKCIKIPSRGAEIPISYDNRF